MTRANADPKGKKPTVAQAKAVWDAEIKPTLDKVFIKLHAAGYTGMAFSTLQRWKARDWPDHKYARDGALAKAKAVVDEVKPPQPKPTSQDPDDVSESSGTEKTELAALSLTALSETAARESLVAQVLLARRIQDRALQLVKFAPKETANLLEALKGPASNVTVVIPDKPAEQPRTVGGNLIEHDASERPLTALQSSIREFRQMKVVK